MRQRSPLILRGCLLILGCALVAVPVWGDEVDDFVRATMEEQKIPGIAIAVVRDGKPARVRGYGLANIELEVPVTPDTIFQSGSVGKQFTAAGILLLAEEGKLKLDDPLALHFPSAPASWHRITIRHLLTHTSGISDSQDDAYEARRDYTEEELLEISFKFPLEFAQTKFELGDQLPISQPVEVVFEFVNVSDHDVTYWTKSSSLRARSSFKKNTVGPGESGTIDVRVATTVAGPFRHRLGVITDDTVRQGLFIEGTVVE